MIPSLEGAVENLNSALEKAGYRRTTVAELMASLRADANVPRVPDLPDTYQGALKVLADKPYLASADYSRQKVRADREGADPDIVRFERTFLRLCEGYNIPMFAHCVVRTAAEQQRLFNEGRSQARPGSSPHNYGMAVDLVHCRKAWELGGKGWDLIGHIGKEAARRANLKMVWGGDWRFYDPAHWELDDWRERRAARS